MMLQEKLYLREGTLIYGTVKKILPYGAQIKIGETNRRSVTAWIWIAKALCINHKGAHIIFINDLALH